jgi:nucleoside-diphosphate-sugar epimerase
VTYTVVGARGFIGSAFVRVLRERGSDVVEMTHDQALCADGDLGHIIYASGVAWDAGKRVAEAVRMHVDVPLALLRKHLRSFTYVSSTRVYGDSTKTHETAPAYVAQGDVYAATKAAGEIIVLGDSRPELRVVRLSNVYGRSFRSGLMSSDFLRQAAVTGIIAVRSSADSEKDHVSVEDVVDVTLRIASSGKERVYNIAAGRNTKQGELLERIAAVSGCRIDVRAGSSTVAFAPIDVARIRSEFDFRAHDILDDVPGLWRDFEGHFQSAKQVAT